MFVFEPAKQAVHPKIFDLDFSCNDAAVHNTGGSRY
jgi:hypothetical protein